jgi:hypothetical protein
MPVPPDDDARERVDAVLEHRARRRRDETERVERRAAAADDLAARAGAHLRYAPVARREVARPANSATLRRRP